jgi:hypothetical protein
MMEDDLEWLDCGEISILTPLPAGTSLEEALADATALLNEAFDGGD